jgi:hypothetical protein
LPVSNYFTDDDNDVLSISMGQDDFRSSWPREPPVVTDIYSLDDIIGRWCVTNGRSEPRRFKNGTITAKVLWDESVEIKPYDTTFLPYTSYKNDENVKLSTVHLSNKTALPKCTPLELETGSTSVMETELSSAYLIRGVLDIPVYIPFPTSSVELENDVMGSLKDEKVVKKYDPERTYNITTNERQTFIQALLHQAKTKIDLMPMKKVSFSICMDEQLATIPFIASQKLTPKKNTKGLVVELTRNNKFHRSVELTWLELLEILQEIPDIDARPEIVDNTPTGAIIIHAKGKCSVQCAHTLKTVQSSVPIE